MKTYLFLAIAAMSLSCAKKMNLDDPRTGNIAFDDAAMLISNFLEDPVLKDFGQSWALSGTFPKDVFYTPTNDINEGALLWFCFNPSDSKHPVLFLSVEKRPSLTSYPADPLPSNLIRPTNVNPYNGNTDKPSVKDYLYLKPESNDIAPRPIGPSLVKKFAAKFDSLLSRNTYSDGSKYCALPLSFFQNELIEYQHAKVPALKALLSQPGTTHVRYYFGFNPKEPENKIRLILFAVDANGKNIIAATKTDGVILQKSIPPR